MEVFLPFSSICAYNMLTVAKASTEIEYLRTDVHTRKKIETSPAKPDYILTEPWVGYRFSNPIARKRLT